MTWILVVLVVFLVYAYGKHRDELARLRKDFERLDARFEQLSRMVRPAVPSIEAEPEPEPEPAPEPAPAPAPEAVRQPAVPPPPPPAPRASRPAPLPRSEAQAPPSPAVLEDPIDHAVAWLRDRVQGVGWTVIVGVIVLFFGVAFLVKYAIDRDLVSIQLRLLAAAIGGIGMVVFGYRAREERPLFGLATQGGGMGVLYLTIFAAFRIYDLVPAALAFAMLVGLVAASAALALSQGSRLLVTLASAGGFLAPILTSTGSGNHVALFSYYLVLNAGILAIAWFRSWRVLNLLGFVFTFAVATIWGALQYRPELFASTEPFLLALFLMYVGVAVLFALRQKPDLKGIVDGTIVFGVPLVVSVLQAALVRDFEYGLAWSAFGFGVFYLALAGFVARKGGETLYDLSESFLATGVVLTTLAVPFAFDELASSVLWALEGAAIVWIGIRQNRLAARLFASALQLAAGMMFLAAPAPTAPSPLLNASFLGALIVAVAGFVTAFQYFEYRDRVEIERPFPVAFLLWGLAWWIGAGFNEIARFALPEDVLGWILLVLALTASLAASVGKSLVWRDLERVALGLLPSSAVVFLAATVGQTHPFEGLTAAGWLMAFSSHALVLWLQRGRDRRLWHAGGLWLGALLASWEASYWVSQWIETPVTWSLVTLGAVLASIVLIVARFVNEESYRTLGNIPIAALALTWLFAANLSSTGDPSPLPYVPFLNPLDLVAALVLVAAVAAHRHARAWLERLGVTDAGTTWIVALLGFFWLHGIIVRSVHHWGHVAFHPEALFASTLVQTSVAVLWAVTGLVLMVGGTRRGLRPVWVAGASLMAAVVAKLFLVDLSHAETVARIVSFIAVGTLLLAVGYLSPAPPAKPLELESRS